MQKQIVEARAKVETERGRNHLIEDVIAAPRVLSNLLLSLPAQLTTPPTTLIPVLHF